MKKVILIKNMDSDLLGFYLNMYGLKIKKQYSDLDYQILSKEEANELIIEYNIKEFPVLLLIEDDILIEKINGFGFLNRIPAF